MFKSHGWRRKFLPHLPDRIRKDPGGEEERRSAVRSGEAGPNRSAARDDEVKQKERRVDALALRAEERRDKLR